MKRYRVWLKSVPGFYEQYSGKVDVYADNDEEAIDLAFYKLKTGAFKDRSKDMWRVEKVERIFER